MVFADAIGQSHYPHHIRSILCYAHRHGYSFSVLDPSRYLICSGVLSIYFKKHCAVMSYLIQNPNTQWLLVLGADTFVVNATRSLESFLPKDPRIYLESSMVFGVPKQMD
ncbi:unnamed protein product [Adineta steineri]|uniref:Uncharacterized protein n=1 Tax=Adineta steineri TaxID=433720 RepID=A0A819P694_9BILA|nr:unnamed protein product [Adineta steineri]